MFESKLFSTYKKKTMLILLLIENIISFFDFLYPKNDKIILFGSNTGEFISGSPKVLFEYVNKNYPGKYEVFYYSPLQKNSKLYNKIKNVIRFFPVFFKAKILICSHPPTDFFPFIAWSNKKIFINTWHGTPIKSIFFADINESKYNLERIKGINRKTSAFIIASDLEAKLIKSCFNLSADKLFYSGHPRNDILMKKKNRNILSFFIKNLPEYKMVILYCPTYRRDAATTFFPFSDLDLNHFNNFLEENKILILIRSHVYAKRPEKKMFSKRIIDFSFNVFNDVNTILPEIDVLVTDYSSIYIDYLLLDRPCIFIPYDLENYKTKRGLLLDYETWTSGPKVLTYKQFIDVIQEILSGIDPYKEKRLKLKKLFHSYQTEDSCKNILKIIDVVE